MKFKKFEMQFCLQYWKRLPFLRNEPTQRVSNGGYIIFLYKKCVLIKGYKRSVVEPLNFVCLLLHMYKNQFGVISAVLKLNENLSEVEDLNCSS